MTKVQAHKSEGIGLKLPKRDPAHEHVQWYELDLDDDYKDPDTEPHDPLPTERHRTVPS